MIGEYNLIAAYTLPFVAIIIYSQRAPPRCIDRSSRSARLSLDDRLAATLLDDGGDALPDGDVSKNRYLCQTLILAPGSRFF